MLYAKMLENVEFARRIPRGAAPHRSGHDRCPAAVRERWLALPDTTSVRDHEVPIDYDVEDGIGGVARLRLPEKMARTLHESELPVLDRPLRFTVHRGARGSLRGATLEELQELLERPWMPEEVERERAPEPARERESRAPQAGARNIVDRRGAAEASAEVGALAGPDAGVADRASGALLLRVR